MTSSLPILDKNEALKGVIASDFNIRDLSLMLSEKRLTPNTTTYLLSKKDLGRLKNQASNHGRHTPESEQNKSLWEKKVSRLEIIASSEDRSPMRHKSLSARVVSLEERNNTRLWNTLVDFYKNKEETFVSTSDTTPNLVSIMPMGDKFGKEWLLVSIVPYQDLTALLFSTQEDTISLYIFILFVSCLQVVLLARRIAYPIEDLREEALKIKAFKLDGPVSVNSNIK